MDDLFLLHFPSFEQLCHRSAAGRFSLSFFLQEDRRHPSYKIRIVRECTGTGEDIRLQAAS